MKLLKFKISDTQPDRTKFLFKSLLMRFRGSLSCQKIRKTKLKTTLMSLSAKIQPKLKKTLKTPPKRIKKSSKIPVF